MVVLSKSDSFEEIFGCKKGGNKMKTSEFIKRVKELGYGAYGVVDGADYIRVRRYRDSGIVAIVFKNKVNALDAGWNEDVSDDLFDLCVEYARTPIEERKDVKKYYLYNPVKKSYFNYYPNLKTYVWSNSTQMVGIQTVFTEEEIENHKFKEIMELLVKKEV